MCKRFRQAVGEEIENTYEFKWTQISSLPVNFYSAFLLAEANYISSFF